MNLENKPKQEASDGAGADVGLFGLSFKDYAEHDDSAIYDPVFDNGDDDWEREIDRQITWYSIIPLSVIGVALNVFIVGIWSMKKEFRALNFYFKSLAVLDAIYIITFDMWWYSPVNTTYQFVIKGIAFGSQYMAVNTTLLLATCHWLSIYRPFQWNALFSPYRTRLSLCIVIAYCATTKFIERVIAWNVHNILDTIVNMTAAQLLLTLPLLIEAAISVAFVRYILSPIQVAPDISTSSSFQRASVQPATDHPPNGHRRLSYSGGAPFSSQELALYNQKKARAVTLTILSIICMTFIAYPIGLAIISYYKLSPVKVEKTTKQISMAVVNLLHIINSSINFFFYFGFIDSFRKGVRQCVCDNFLVGYKSVAEEPISNPPTYTGVGGGELIRRSSFRENIPNAHITGGFQKTESGKSALIYVVQVKDEKSDIYSTDDETSSIPRDVDG